MKSLWLLTGRFQTQRQADLTDTMIHYGVQPHGSFHDATADTVAAVDPIVSLCAAYPQAGVITVAGLWIGQRNAHETWKEQFNAYLESQDVHLCDSWFPYSAEYGKHGLAGIRHARH